MATSTCVKCGHSSFEMVTNTRVSGTNHNIFFIQCTSCGGVVGVLHQRSAILLEEVAKKQGISR